MVEECTQVCICPPEGIITMISKKWAILVISILGHHGRLRFSALMQALGQISPKSLTDLLKELQKEGLVERRTFPEVPPRVEYSLTEEGHQLSDAIDPLMRWVEKRDNLHANTCHADCRSAGCPLKKV